MSKERLWHARGNEGRDGPEVHALCCAQGRAILGSNAVVDVVRVAATAMLALLAAAALTVVARRFAGALQIPLAPPALWLIATLIGAASIGIHLAVLSRAARAGRCLGLAVMAVTSLAVAGLALGVCLPGTSTGGQFVLCTLLLAEQSWAWARYIRQAVEPPAGMSPDSLGVSAGVSGNANTVEHVNHRAHHASSVEALVDSDVGVLSKDVTQQLVRTQTADGAEQICGRLRIAFAAGQRTGSVHVAFCPPLAATPEVEVEQLDGPPARIKTAQLLPYGARLDLKLAAAADEQTSVLLQFSARTVSREK